MNARNSQLPDTDKDGYRSLPGRAPFRKLHPPLLSVHGPVGLDGGVGPKEPMPPLSLSRFSMHRFHPDLFRLLAPVFCTCSQVV